MEDKKYKLSDPEIIESIPWLLSLFAIMLLKYAFPSNPTIQKYFSGLPQIAWVVGLFGLMALRIKAQNKKKNNKTK